MVAPLLPRLADVFEVSVETIGLIVPAYLIPYGAATLVYGPLSDRFGRGQIILASLLAFIVLTAVTAVASGLRRACSCYACLRVWAPAASCPSPWLLGRSRLLTPTSPSL